MFKKLLLITLGNQEVFNLCTNLFCYLWDFWGVTLLNFDHLSTFCLVSEC